MKRKRWVAQKTSKTRKEKQAKLVYSQWSKELKDQKKAEKEARKKELSAKKEARKLLKTKGDTDGTDEGDVKDDAEGEGGTGEVGVEEGVKSLGI